MTESFFGGAPGLSWPKADGDHVYRDVRLRGVARGGLILDEPRVEQMTEMGTGKPLTWPDGRPKQQMVVTLLCDGSTGGLDERDPANPADRGERRLYIRGYMKNAIGEALRKVGVTGLQRGGVLLVAWIDEKPSKTANFDPARIWAAQYSTPAVGLPEGGAQSQPQQGLSGAPSANPFGGAGQQPAAPQVPAQPTGYDPSQYQPPAAPVPQQPANPFSGGATVTGPPAQQPAPVAPPANPFG